MATHFSVLARRIPGLISFRMDWLDFLVGPVVKTSSSIADNRGLIPGQGAKISYVLQLKNQNIRQKQKETTHWKRP